MERDLQSQALQQLCVRYPSARGRLERRIAEKLKQSREMPRNEVEESAGLEVLQDLARTYGVDPYLFMLRLAVEDSEERERLIQAYRDEMVESMPDEDHLPADDPGITGPFDVPQEDLPPRDASYDEPDYSKPPKPRRRAGLPALGEETAREIPDVVVKPEEYASFK